ncbi:MAG: site-specific integrase [Terriglobales bacterium]
MTLWKRGNVFWAYVYVDGIRHAKSTGTGNRRIAEQIEQRFKEELNLKRQGMSQLAPDMTFGELAARFLAEGIQKRYHLDRLKVLLPYFGETPIGRISKALARDYRTRRHAEKRVSDTTVNRDLEALRHILFWAVDEGLLASNPLSRVRMVRERRKPRLMVSLEEETALLSTAAPHLRSIIIAALDTGMRRGEILAERWEHVDFTRALLYVTKSKTAEGEAREIPLTGRFLEWLQANRQAEGLIFTFKDRPIRKIKTAWKAAFRRAGIRYFRFHDLRHTFNTRLMEAGVMQEVRKALMGHSSGEDVNAIYTHVELPVKREAIRKLEVWVRGQSTIDHLGQDGRNPNAEPTTARPTTPEPTTSDRSDPRASVSERPGAE